MELQMKTEQQIHFWSVIKNSPNQPTTNGRPRFSLVRVLVVQILLRVAEVAGDGCTKTKEQLLAVLFKIPIFKTLWLHYYIFCEH